jgi:hypothetical protein
MKMNLIKDYSGSNFVMQMDMGKAAPKGPALGD